jgi:hypothetical protein
LKPNRVLLSNTLGEVEPVNDEAKGLLQTTGGWHIRDEKSPEDTVGHLLLLLASGGIWKQNFPVDDFQGLQTYLPLGLCKAEIFSKDVGKEIGLGCNPLDLIPTWTGRLPYRDEKESIVFPKKLDFSDTTGQMDVEDG